MADKDSEIDNNLPDEVIDSLESFYRSMNTVEESLEPILSVSSENVHGKLNVLDRAKLDIMMVYAMNSMFWIYLISQGINPKEHGVRHELSLRALYMYLLNMLLSSHPDEVKDRVKNYMGKIKEVSDKKKASLKINKEAAKRFVRSALWNAVDKKETKDQESLDVETTESEKRISKKDKRKKEASFNRRKKHKAD